MADSKSRYSEASKIYAGITRHGSMIDAIRYYRSKLRELKYNDSWKKHPANINDIVAKFAQGAKGQAKGVKYQFENSRYIVKADMPSGYLRIFDKNAKMYTKIDGTPSKDFELTHFKILKRKEMKL